jgi:AcrR family transcriptional regulator
MNASGPAAQASTTPTVVPVRSPTADRAMRADARRNYQRLLTAAGAAFAEHGADDVSLEEIARRAGVGIGTLYRHFPTRQALLEAVYRDQVEALRARADELLESAPAEVALTAWLRDLLEFGRTKRRLSAALMATLGKDSELLSTCGTLLRSSVTDVLNRAQEAGVVRADAEPADVLRLVHAISLTTEWAPDPGQAGRLLALVLDGLRSQHADQP